MFCLSTLEMRVQHRCILNDISFLLNWSSLYKLQKLYQVWKEVADKKRSSVCLTLMFTNTDTDKIICLSTFVSRGNSKMVVKYVGV